MRGPAILDGALGTMTDTIVAIRALMPADRDTALPVINGAARWSREFLPAGEYHEPEMTPEAWGANAAVRRATADSGTGRCSA